MKPRNQPPSGLSVNEWIELRTPERVRKCPEQRQDEPAHDEQHVPDLQHPLLLLDHHRVEECRGGEPRHEGRVLDGIPGVVAAPAHLDVGPVRADQLADPEEAPRGERPAPRRDDPALVGAPGEQRPHPEGERDGQSDEAEVERTGWISMCRFCRLGLSPAPSGGATCVSNGLETATSMKAKKTATPPSTGHDPCDEVGRLLPVDEHDRRGVRGQGREPQEQGSLLSSPEGGQCVQRGQAARAVLGHVREAEVVAGEGAEEDDRGDGRCPERGDERVPCRERQTAPAPERGVAARGGRVHRQAEADDECGPA